MLQQVNELLTAGKGHEAIRCFLQQGTPQPSSSAYQNVLKRLLQWQSVHRREHFSPDGAATTATITAVLIPRPACSVAMLRTVKGFIEKQGYEVVDVLSFANPPAAPAPQAVFGPEGHEIGVVYICADLCPWAPTALDRMAWPDVDNTRNLTLRGLVQRVIGYRAQGHGRLLTRTMIHALRFAQVLKNTEHTWSWLCEIPGVSVAAYKKQVNEWTSAFRVPFPVKESLSRYAGAARIDTVHYRGSVAVCKTFRPGRDAAFQNERAVYAHTEADDRTPALLESGDNWFIIEHVPDMGSLHDTKTGHLDPEHVVQAFEWLYDLHEAGFVHTDFHPENVFVRDDGSLCFIDFEHCFRWTGAAFPFSLSPNFSPAKWDELAVSCPIGGPRPYAQKWAPYTSLSQEALLCRLTS